MATRRPKTTAASLALGITDQQIAAMQRKVAQLEEENQSIGLTRVRHAIDLRLVEIRALLRDGHTRNVNNLNPEVGFDANLWGKV